MGRPSRRARKIRKGNEFDLAQLIGRLNPPKSSQGVYSWSLESIRNARDSQLAGKFELPARLAESMRTDDALFTAYENRLAPQRCLGVELKAASSSAQAERVASEAEGLFGPKGIGVRPETLADINGALANHGVAFGVNVLTPRDDGSRVDLEMRTWPIEWVRWSPTDRCFLTRVQDGPEIPIVHGDGRWVVFAKHEHEPWKQEACVLPGALVWARHAFAQRDWARGSTAHGNAKVVGELPEGIPLIGADGVLTAEAAAFLALLQAINSVEAPAGIRPFGSKTEYLTNGSSAWQVWNELSMSGEKSSARIYLGTDGMLGSVGGAPGVDISTLFGVATTKVQGDLACIERGVLTGCIEIWAAINHGDSALAPERCYQMPDPDADAQRESVARRTEAFHRDVEKLRANGFVVDQSIIDKLATQYGIPVPRLPEKKTEAPSITLAPTDIARVVSVNEARASAGLGALALPSGGADPDGLLTVEEFSAKKAAGVKPPTAVLPPPAPAHTNGAPAPS